MLAAAGGTCTFSIVFSPNPNPPLTPAGLGPQSAVLTITGSNDTVPLTVSLTGTGVQPVTVTPATLPFGNQALSTLSAPLSVTITNNLSTPLSGSSLGFNITGSGSNNFQTGASTCSSTLLAAAGGTCTFSIVFSPSPTPPATPAGLGPQSALLTITGSNDTVPLTVSITGTGVQPVTVAPATLPFGNQALNTLSAPLSVTITNNRSTPISGTSLGFNITGPGSNNFQTGASTCGSTLLAAAGGTCTVSIVFSPSPNPAATPAGLGPQSAVLTITGTNDTVPLTVSLTGTGVQPVTVAPATLPFGNQILGSPSAPMTVTITNNTSASLPVVGLGFSITGSNFQRTAAATNNCNGATPLAPLGGFCNIAIQFLPSATPAANPSGLGAQLATLTVTGTPDTTAPTVALSGTGVQPVTVSPAILAFGNQALGSTPSAPLWVIVTNNQSTPLSGSSLSFSITGSGSINFQTDPSTCNTVLTAAGGTCTFSVVFRPSPTPPANPAGLGPQSAVLKVTGGPITVPLTVSLTGTGVQPFTATPSPLAFGNQGLGSPSAPLAVTITNNLSTPFTGVLGYGLTGSTSFVTGASTCNTSIPAGGACTVSVVFSPSPTPASAPAGMGPQSATLTISGTGDTAPLTVNVTGTGVQPVTISLPGIRKVTNPPTLDFGDQALFTFSDPRTVLVTNNLNGPTNAAFYFGIASTTNPDPVDFLPLTGTCGTSPVTLPANGTCTILVKFSPEATGTRSAVLSFSTSDSVQPAVALTGTGILPVSVSPATLAFGNRAVGTSSVLPVTITNNQSTSFAGSALGFSIPSGTAFHVGTSTCGSTTLAAAGGTCTVNIQYTAGPGAQSATLTVTYPPATMLPVGLSGTGVQAPAITSASSATFTVGTAGSFLVTAVGFPPPSLKSSRNIPAGMTFTDNGNGTGTLSGTPSAGTGGPYNVTFTASNGVGSNATQTFVLTVDQAPSITSANKATFTVGTAGTFTVAAAGYPAPTFVGSGLPAWATFNKTTGVLSGTPAAGTGGLYSLTFTAGNGVGSNTTQTFALTVDESPAITSANNATFTMGTAGSFTVTATGYPTYPTLILNLVGKPPAGVTFDNATHVLSGTPTEAGMFTLSFRANNGVPPLGTQTFTLTVPKGSQTITFGPLASQVLGSAPFTVAATATSGLAVSFSTPTNTVCGVTGTTVTLNATGTCTIQASQGGNAIYVAATVVTQSFQVTAGFVATGSMITAREFHTATLLNMLNNGKVLIAGGTNDLGTVFSSAELYDPATATFTATGSMTTAREHHTATLLNNGKVLITGGDNFIGTLSSADLYDPTTGKFTAAGSMTTAREHHTATLLNNGNVVIAGGFESTPGSVLLSAELYNPATGTFTATGPMTTRFEDQTATLLKNGEVFIQLGYADLYDPVAGTFAVTGSSTYLSGATATLLNNGKVLIAGGINGANVVASGARLYSY